MHSWYAWRPELALVSAHDLTATLSMLNEWSWLVVVCLKGLRPLFRRSILVVKDLTTTVVACVKTANCFINSNKYNLLVDCLCEKSILRIASLLLHS